MNYKTNTMQNKILKIYGKQKVYFVTIQDKNSSVVNLLIEADSSYRLRPTLNANGFADYDIVHFKEIIISGVLIDEKSKYGVLY